MPAYVQYLERLYRRIGLRDPRGAGTTGDIQLVSVVQDWTNVVPATAGIAGRCGTNVMLPGAPERATVQLYCREPTLVDLMQAFHVGGGPSWYLAVVPIASALALANTGSVLPVGNGTPLNTVTYGNTATSVLVGTATYADLGSGTTASRRPIYVAPGNVLQVQRATLNTIDQVQLAWRELPSTPDAQ